MRPRQLSRDRNFEFIIYFFNRNTSGSFRRKINAMRTLDDGRVFTQLFQVLPNFHEYFYNPIETQRKCFLFPLGKYRNEKRKQLTLFDHQNVNYSLLVDSGLSRERNRERRI